MKNRIKSIFKKDSRKETKTDDDVSTQKADLLNKKHNAAHTEQIQKITPEHLEVEDEALSGQSQATQVSLWDTAYDQLKEEEGTRELLATYEALLSGVSIKGTNPSKFVRI